MRVARFRFQAILAALAGATLTVPISAPAADAKAPSNERVAPEVEQAVAGGARTRVFVTFDMPVPKAPLGGAQPGDPQTKARIAATRARVLAQAPASQIEVVHAFDHVSGIAAIVDAAGLARLAADPDVVRIEPDPGGRGLLAEAVALTRIDVAQGLGLSGNGVTVAVLDSGYDSDHPDLADDLVGEACFCSGGCCPSGADTQQGPGSAEDDNGHGTNVSGIITGAGLVAPAGGAPDVDVVAVKVLDENSRFCCTSDIVAGLDWLISNRPDVDIVNLSLGTDLLYSGDCDASEGVRGALTSAIDTLDAMGVAVFAGAGNDGSETQMPAPACVANAISVGAVWDSDQGMATGVGCQETSTAADQVTCFSNRNASTDLFAPGARTTAAGMGGGATTFTGTSQATALAAACAALIFEADPALMPADVEALMEMSPKRVGVRPDGLDHPRLDCAHAIAVPEPGAAASGLAALATVAAIALARVRGASPTRRPPAA